MSLLYMNLELVSETIFYYYLLLSYIYYRGASRVQRVPSRWRRRRDQRVDRCYRCRSCSRNQLHQTWNTKRLETSSTHNLINSSQHLKYTKFHDISRISHDEFSKFHDDDFALFEWIYIRLANFSFGPIKFPDLKHLLSYSIISHWLEKVELFFPGFAWFRGWLETM